MTQFPKGTQVLYIPPHAGGDAAHADVEAGFVLGATKSGHYLCRFWRRDGAGELRTVANSEMTPADRLKAHDTVEQAVVEQTIRDIEACALLDRYRPIFFGRG